MKFALLFAGFLFLFWQELVLGQTLEEMSIPLDVPSEYLDSAKASVKALLSEIGARPVRSPRHAVSKSGQFVRWGNLFQTGGCFALLELEPEGVAFAEWTNGKWELRGLWKLDTVWRPKGYKPSDGDYLPTTPATQPFEMRDLSGDGVSEVVAAGEVDRYFQSFYLLRFSVKTRTLRLVAVAMDRPTVAGRYVRLYSDSGRLSIFQEWEFFKWQGDDLKSVASWHDEVGYHSKDPTFSEGTRTNERGEIETVRVLYGKGIELAGDPYQLTRMGKDFGEMEIHWKDEKSLNAMDSEPIEKAWLFEKMTGLPRRLYPGRKSENVTPRLEDVATVTVRENAEAEKLFSTQKK